jgi:hypothetical protein
MSFNSELKAGRVASVAGFIVALAGCGIGGVESQASASVVTVPMYAWEPGAVTHIGEIRGVLGIRNDCVSIRTERGAWVLVAFPDPGTVWIPATATLRVHGQQFRIVYEVRFGGGEFASPADTGEWVIPPLPECQQQKHWLIESVGTSLVPVLPAPES